MPYGQAADAGLISRIPNYAELLSSGTVAAASIVVYRTEADTKIDRLLKAAGVLPANLPLAVSTDVDAWSDAQVGCKIGNFVFMDKEPDESSWVDKICEEATTLEEEILADATTTFAALMEDADGDSPKSTTEDLDRKMSIGQTSGGTTVSDGTMDDWDDVT